MDLGVFFCFFLLASGISCKAQEITGSLSYNFTLAAVNVTLPNANLTGAPLVLGQDGKSRWARFVLEVYLTFHVLL